MDPLSDVLSLLKPRSYRCRGVDIGGDLAFRFGQHEGIKCYAVVSGRCWLLMESAPEAIELKMGDCVLLPKGAPFCLATDPSVAPVDGFDQLAAHPGGGVATLNGGGACFMFGAHFLITSGHADLLTRLLPPVIHIRSEGDKAELSWALDRMRKELQGGQPGSLLLAQHLAYMILVQALRLHLEERPPGSVGWLFALADNHISRAISAIHDAPADPWTLQTLAHHAGMSRSQFSRRFREVVGATPMEYITRWRMLLASDRLSTSGDAISQVALSLGYESERAFRKAFKKVMGCSPHKYSSTPKRGDWGGTEDLRLESNLEVNFA
jgi:AraC-like DNA-binding protein